MDGQDIWMLSEAEIVKLGIPVTSKGYYYLIAAVVISFGIGIQKASMTKEIYLRIAEMNGVTGISVERDIRNCIIKAWADRKGALRCIYPEYVKNPTNSEVIAFITSRIRLETEPGI